jgi:PAS domain S-box-containing protein
MAESEPPGGPEHAALAPPPPTGETPPLDDSLFFQLFDLSPLPTVVTRLSDHTVLAVNKSTSDVFQVSQEAALGRKAHDYYVHPEERLNLATVVEREGRADNVRLEARRPDGSTFWLSVSARRVAFDGEPAMLSVFTDVTEALAAQRALEASKRRLAAQSRALMELTARHADPVVRFENRLRTILEAAAATLDVERLSMWRTADDRGSIRCVGLYARTPARHESGTVLARAGAPAYFDALERERVIAATDASTDPRTADFSSGYLMEHGIGAMLDVPLRQDDRMIGVLCAEHVGGARAWTVDEQNFTIAAANLIVVALADEERREALARLADSEARARLIIDTAHDAFVGIDARGRIVSWNAQAEAIFGWTRDEALGRDMAETIIPPSFRDAHNRGLAHFRRTGEAPVINKRLELAALHRSGREFPIEITITAPMPHGQGDFFGAFLRDISERRERDAQLRRAKDAAEAATRAKSEFLANMSHELRTPLNGVLGYTQLLQRDRSLAPSQRDALEAIGKCGSHLLDLINDVLDLSRIEAGRIDIEATTTDLAQLIIDLKYVVAESARRKGLLLRMSIGTDVPRRVVLDGRHLRQVLLNLLGNAVKFTNDGEVTLRICRAADSRLLFDVRDTGVGIEPDALSAIFDAFTQTRAGAAAGGTGLGLAISRHLVETMGDELRVESVPGKGSRFFFALPLVAGESSGASDVDVSDEPPLDARLAPGEDLTAMVVDDSTVSRRILGSLLESAGVRVIPAAGGREALRLAAEHRPDVIFMDLRMVDLDGLEVTRRLKNDACTASIPVVAVTANAFGDTRAAALDAGCVEYLPKPVRAESLFAALAHHLGVRFIAGPAAEVQPTGEPHASDTTRRLGLARRIHELAGIGSVTDLEALAQHIVSSEPADAAIGQRIARLVAAFDFDGLRELANRLAGEESDRRGRS